MSAEEKPKLYIALFSIHGLIRGKNLELGRDADTDAFSSCGYAVRKTCGCFKDESQGTGPELVGKRLKDAGDGCCGLADCDGVACDEWNWVPVVPLLKPDDPVNGFT